MKKWDFCLVAFLLLTLCGCASFKAGWHMGTTESAALDKYLVVDEAGNSIGYTRLKAYTVGDDAFGEFLQKHGLPDFTHYSEKKGKKCVELLKLFYLESNEVFEFNFKKFGDPDLENAVVRELNEEENKAIKGIKLQK